MSEMPKDQIKRLALHLSRSERMRLAAWLEGRVDADAQTTSRHPVRSLYGLWADGGSSPSSSDIDAVRHEMWRDFPRADIV